MLYIVFIYIMAFSGSGRSKILSFPYDLISRALPHKIEPLEFNLIGFEDKNILFYWSLLR